MQMFSKISSSFSNDESYTSVTSASDGSSHQPKSKPNYVVSMSSVNSNCHTERPHDTVLSPSARASAGATCDQAPDFCCQPNSGREIEQSQALFDYNSDSSFYDPDLELREQARRRGDYRPRLQWELMSIQYQKWFERMMVNCPEPVTENLATFEPSPDITLPLLRYQKEWLAWGLSEEVSGVRGGILADEMGMGKTIQAISLVVTARGLRAKSEASCSSSKGSNKCTLVICPLVALIQWEQEIEKYTVNGSVNVLVFHGKKRPRGSVDFRLYDFVLTTYSTVESDYRKYNTLPEESSHKFANIKALTTQQRKFCGPNANKTSLRSKYEMKGKKKMKMTTPTDPPLHSTRWERIILDEAHLIKDTRSNTAKAVFDLESDYKWALTGTPLENRVQELFSLIRFLQIYPYSCHLCKDCDCSVQNYFSSYCPNCEHSMSTHFCWWNKYIAQPIELYSDSKHDQRAMLLLREVLKSILLSRTKLGRAADYSYPPKYVKLRQDSMDESEKAFYKAMYTQSRSQFDLYVEAGTLTNNYDCIFYMLIRLQQAVDHPYLVLYPSWPEACGFCHSEAKDPVITTCEHIFCTTCWENYLGLLGRLICPTCLTLLTVSPKRKTTKVKGFKSSSILNKLDLSKFRTSTKIEALKEEIRDMIEDVSAKAIVLSQFTSFLDLIGYSLNMAGVNWVLWDRSMNIDDRDKAVKAFSDDADCKILLMNLKASVVAPNLTVASYVFLIDPWWNPAAEKQAQDRVHRIGQYKPIRVIRFVIENTIEERILKLQSKKELVFDSTVGNIPNAMAKLSAEDLHFLFTV